jgi:hypothetical protein
MNDRQCALLLLDAVIIGTAILLAAAILDRLL